VDADSPEAYWRLDELSGTLAQDASGNGNNASYVNAPGLGADPLITTRNSVNFDGSTEYANFSALSLTFPFTLEAWVEPGDFESFWTFLDTNWQASTYGGAALQVTPSRTVSLRFGNNTDTSAFGRRSHTTTDRALVVGEPNHVVAVARGINDVSIYINGVDSTLSSSGSASSVDFTSTEGRIAAGDNGDFFNGRVDEAAIYNHELSLSRAQTHYDVGTGGGPDWNPAYLFAGAQEGAWYSPSDLSTLFQDAAGTTPVAADGDPVARVEDKSGNGNHLTQSTAARRMTYRTDGTHHWLESVDDFLETAAIIGSASDVSLIAAVNLQDVSGYSAGFRTIASQGTHPGQDWGVYWLSSGSDDLVFITNSESVRWEEPANDDSLENWTVWAVRGGEGDQDFYQDGSLVGSDTQTGFNPAGTETLRIGYDNGSDRYWNGFFGDIIIVGEHLSDADRQLAEDYVAGNMPS
jgi:hypothetical protein